MLCSSAPRIARRFATGFIVLLLLLSVADSTALAGRRSRVRNGTPRPEEPADPTTTRYRCAAGLSLTATVTRGKSPSARVEIGEDVWVLPRVPSASGTRYSDGRVSFWVKGESVRFESPDLSVTCANAVGSAEGITSLSATEWKLVSLTWNGETIGVPEGITIDATFEDGHLMGRGVCNRYFASYKVSPDRTIAVGDVGATLMMCPEHADLERRYFQMLKSATRFDVRKGTLELTSAAGALRYVELR